MREQKFRAWDKKKKYMFYPTELMLNIQGEHQGRVEWVYDEEDCKVFDFVLLEYTGFKFNDVEAYAGDIIKYIDPWGRKEVDHIEGEVIFGKGEYSSHAQGADDIHSYYGWLIKDKYNVKPLTQDSCYKVVGNIYSNPELLKK